MYIISHGSETEGSENQMQVLLGEGDGVGSQMLTRIWALRRAWWRLSAVGVGGVGEVFGEVEVGGEVG